MPRPKKPAGRDPAGDPPAAPAPGKCPSCDGTLDGDYCEACDADVSPSGDVKPSSLRAELAVLKAKIDPVDGMFQEWFGVPLERAREVDKSKLQSAGARAVEKMGGLDAMLGEFLGPFAGLFGAGGSPPAAPE